MISLHFVCCTNRHPADVDSQFSPMSAPFDAAKPLSKSKSPSMSLEQALFEEEQEVLLLIGARHDSLPPPAPPPIGANSSRNGSVSKSSMLGPIGSLNSKTARSASNSVPGARRDNFEGLLTTSGYQFPVATNALNRAAADLSGNRRKSAPDSHHRRSSSPAPRPLGLKPTTTSPPPALKTFDKAYRRLSNAAMAQSGGSLGRLAGRPLTRSNMSAGSVDLRLEKDKDPDSVIESSSTSESESETSRPTSRTSSPRLKASGSRDSQDELRYETQQTHIPLSLSAAAEQERSSLLHSNFRRRSCTIDANIQRTWSSTTILP
jgi:hypothetical protein